jgi:hypothetical protein
MIEIKGLKGQITQYKLHQKMVWGTIKSMGEYSTIISFKIFAAKDSTPEEFERSLHNVRKGVWVVVDATLTATECANNQGQPLKHPDGHVMFEHYLRVRDIQLISPCYAQEHQEPMPTPQQRPEPAQQQQPAPQQTPTAPALAQQAPKMIPPPPRATMPSFQAAPPQLPWLAA